MKRIIYILLIVVVVLITWEYFGQNFTKFRFLFSSPSFLAEYILEDLENLLISVFVTFSESLLGLLTAILFSFATMIVCIYYPKLLRVVLPIFIGSQVVPIIAIAPLLIMIFGIGIQAKVVIAAIMCFFPLFMNFLAGINSIPSEIKDLLHVYNASKKFTILRVYFPLSIPNIFTGLKVSATLSVIGAIVGEFTGAELGLGKNLFVASKKLDPELMMASLMLSIFLGGIMYLTVYFVEKRLGHWYLD